MTTTTTLTKDNFKEKVQTSPTLIVDFWAPWCGPCRAFAPTFERVAARHADVTFAKVNTQEQPELAGALGIRAIPTLMAFRDGIAIFEQAGALPEQVLEELVTKVQALDMDKVRQELDEHEKSDHTHGHHHGDDHAAAH
jgi:thioredoxin 2